MLQRRIKLTTTVPALIGMILVLTFGTVFLVSLRASQQNVSQALITSSQPIVKITTQLVFNPLYTLDVATVRGIIAQFIDGVNTVYAVVRDETGALVVDAGEGWHPSVAESQALSQQAMISGGFTTLDSSQPGADDYLVLVYPVAVGNERIGTVEYVFSRGPLSAALGVTQRTISIALGMGLIAALTLVMIIIRGAAAPLPGLAKAASQMGQGDLSVPIDVRGVQEVADLGVALEQMRDQLGRSVTELEERVEVRTEELEKRRQQLTASSEVSRRAVSIMDSDILVREIVDLIKERFDLYYVGLFLVDESRQWAVLRAGTGEAGRLFLERGHRIRVGSGMIGWSVANSQARVAQEARKDEVRLTVPELPDTKSEAAIPLRSRNQCIGALTVQDSRSGIFDAETVAVLQTMADQVAAAIDNTRLLAESQGALDAQRRAYGQLERDAWVRMLQSRATVGYRYDGTHVASIPSAWGSREWGGSTMAQAARSGRILQVREGGRARLFAPVKVRDQVLGVLDISKDDADTEWAAAEVGLLETLLDQLSISLERARSYQETQGLAQRERVLGEIGGRVRQTLDIETILKTASQELRQALNLSKVVVRLGTPADAQGDQLSITGDRPPMDPAAEPLPPASGESHV